jgi:hypothetical protein
MSVLAILWIFYLLMFLNYRAYDVDNPWFLSFSHGACVEHVATDQFMDVRFPYGMDGTQFFGKIAAGAQCAVLGHLGWLQWPAEILASGLIVASLGMWWMQLSRLGYSEKFTIFFTISVGLSEPALAAANRFRYEPVSFALISLGLLLAAQRRPFWGMFLAALAIEVQPAALAGVVAVFLLCWSLELPRRQTLIQIGAGLFSAACVYCVLHGDIFRTSHSPDALGGHWASEPGGFLTSYFVQRLRHLPELLFFVAAAVLYWGKRASIGNHYLAMSAGAITLWALILPHGNTAYMIFLYPFLVAVAMQAFSVEGKLLIGFCVVGLYFLPQYAAVTFLNRGRGYRDEEFARVSRAISEAAREKGVSDNKARIYGDYGLWFAHPTGYRAAAQNTLSKIQDADVYVCYDRPIEPRGFVPAGMLHCGDIQRLVSLKLVETVSLRGNALNVYTAN